MNDDTKKTLGRIMGHTAVAAELSSKRPGFQRVAKLGFLVKGGLFLVIGSLAVLLAAGFRGGKLTDARGALAAISGESYGYILLLVFVVGATAHGVWNLLRSAADIDGVGRGWLGITKRVIGAGIGFFYIGLALSALEIMTVSTGGQGNSVGEETFVSILLLIPILGTLMLLIVGLGLVGAGFSELYVGVSGRFRDNYRIWELKGVQLAIVTVLGVISFTARAVLLVIMGYFFLRAAFVGLDGPIGLDAALRTLLLTGYGPTAVILTGIGLIGHGILAFYEAKYRRISKPI